MPFLGSRVVLCVEEKGKMDLWSLVPEIINFEIKRRSYFLSRFRLTEK